MRLFNTISLEIGSLCNRKCWFCPNAYNKRPNEFMPLELLKKVADELAAIKYKGRIALYMFNEPLLDSRLTGIINLFRTRVPRSCIMIATNGDLVKDKQQFIDLFDAGLNQLQVNVYSNVPRFRELQEMMQQIPRISNGSLYNYISPKNRMYSLEEKYDKKITPSTPKIGRFELTNRCGTIPGMPIVMTEVSKVCPRPFRFMQVNWKGEAVLCCNDYNAKVICGDIKQQSVVDIWENSVILREYRTALLTTGRRDLELCRLCAFKGSYSHMVAPCWPELQPE